MGCILFESQVRDIWFRICSATLYSPVLLLLIRRTNLLDIYQKRCAQEGTPLVESATAIEYDEYKYTQKSFFTRQKYEEKQVCIHIMQTFINGLPIRKASVERLQGNLNKFNLDEFRIIYNFILQLKLKRIWFEF